jgi:hypothetical protein
MKNLFPSLILATLFISCNKEKQYSIVGSWKEVSKYHKDSTGVYSWNDDESVSRFNYVISFWADGTCSAFSDIPEWNGKYEYDYNSGQLKITYSSNSNTVDTVSQLNKDYLIFEDYNNGELISMHRYRRLSYP